MLRRLYRDAAVPPALRDGPIVHTYRDADADADHARRLRHIQNLAAVLAGAVEEVVLDDNDDTRCEILTATLNEVRHQAIAAGIPSADIDRAHEVGSSGLTWTEHPSHRLLGRIEQLTEALQRASDDNAALDSLLSAAHRRELDSNLTIQRLHTRVAVRDKALRELVVTDSVGTEAGPGTAISGALDSTWPPEINSTPAHWDPAAEPIPSEVPPADGGTEVER
ncbi:hypothetical protein [Nocardia blacklockiae]|uniref:hypothetical protein n=1 Tax=Nocardia blacklockiae TaxID=480036 RepID=UPI00189604E3|nr:hypothetical protein [Nocardia blacklockiae]MBF6176036.1 hypothetical protein [Nocardia blacklockiae]